MNIAVGLDLKLGGYDWLLGRAMSLSKFVRGRLDLVYIGTLPDAAERLEALLQQVPESERGAARVVQGEPEEELVAITKHYDVLVVGPREPQGLERLFQSAMAVRVLRRSFCPVYVPRTDRQPVGKVRMLVGIDPESSRLAFVLRETNRVALRFGAIVDLLHAVPGTLVSTRRPELNAVLDREWQAKQKQFLVRVSEHLETLHPDVRGEALVLRGEAADLLVEASSRYDVLVVGNRDHTGIERFLLGGVARSVVVKSACDVLVLPTELGDGA